MSDQQPRRRKVRILHLIGLEDDGVLQVEFMSADPTKLRYACLGNVDLLGLIDKDRFRVQTVMCGGLPSEPVELVRPDVILNAICDPDSNETALVAAEKIIERLEASKKKRPLLQVEEWPERVKELLAKREPMYSKADLTIELDGDDVRSGAARVFAALGELGLR